MSSISAQLKIRIRRQARDRCGYCQTPQKIVSMPLEIEHIIPQALGGTDAEENLWLACRNCNGFKRSKTHGIDPETGLETKLFDPRHQVWGDHFEYDAGQTQIFGKTDCGRATVIALRLNFEQAVAARSLWVSVGWFPPSD